MRKNLQNLEIQIIKVYKTHLSPVLYMLFKGGCRYEPTCSVYAMQSISKYGPFKGVGKSVIRFLSCNPLSKHTRSFPLR